MKVDKYENKESLLELRLYIERLDRCIDAINEVESNKESIILEINEIIDGVFEKLKNKKKLLYKATLCLFAFFEKYEFRAISSHIAMFGIRQSSLNYSEEQLAVFNQHVTVFKNHGT